jgi:hypothetical protein
LKLPAIFVLQFEINKPQSAEKQWTAFDFQYGARFFKHSAFSDLKKPPLMGATAAFGSAVFPAVMLPTFQGVSLQMTGLFLQAPQIWASGGVSVCVF